MSMRKAIFRKVLLPTMALVALLFAYVAGAYSLAKNVWPIQELRNIRNFLVGSHQSVTRRLMTADAAKFDFLDRLVIYPGKIEASCPMQDARTGVFLLVGQSNAANHAGQRYASEYGERVLNYFSQKCYVSQSPLLGTTGQWGESWTLFGNKVIETGLFDTVILVPAGIKGASVSRWQIGGDLNKMLLEVIDSLKHQYRITHVLWHQGERDFEDGMPGNDYTRRFKSMLAAIRDKGVDAPVFVSVATKCGKNLAWNSNNPVASAQKSLPRHADRVFPGVDTDDLLSELDRFDDCHLSATGQEQFAKAWILAIKNASQNSPAK